MNLDSYDKIFHLSHVDLDGLACSTLVNNEVIGFGIIERVNTQYGEGVDNGVNTIVYNAREYYMKNRKDKVLVLVTDLGLTEEQVKKIDGLACDKIVIDHHPVQFDLSPYPWYKLDETTAATQLVFEYLNCTLTCEAFVASVSSYDTFNKTVPHHFRTGRVINESLYVLLQYLDPEIQSNVSVIIDFLTEVSMNMMLSPENLEIKMPKLMRKSMHIKNSTIHEELCSIAASELDDSSNMYILTYNGIEYAVLAASEIRAVSTVAGAILDNNGAIDIVMSINTSKGTVSLRSKGDTAVNVISRDLFGGWGHINAAGGKSDRLVGEYVKDVLLRIPEFRKMEKD